MTPAGAAAAVLVVWFVAGAALAILTIGRPRRALGPRGTLALVVANLALAVLVVVASPIL